MPCVASGAAITQKKYSILFFPSFFHSLPHSLFARDYFTCKVAFFLSLCFCSDGYFDLPSLRCATVAPTIAPFLPSPTAPSATPPSQKNKFATRAIKHLHFFLFSLFYSLSESLAAFESTPTAITTTSSTVPSAQTKKTLRDSLPFLAARLMFSFFSGVKSPKQRVFGWQCRGGNVQLVPAPSEAAAPHSRSSDGSDGTSTRANNSACGTRLRASTPRTNTPP